MPKVKKEIVDEHENMEPVFSQKKNHIAVILLFIIAISVIVYIAIGIIKRERERQRIDEIVNSIQNEIYQKQSHLNKVYCCGYKDKDACKKWVTSNCTEENGSLEINCNIKY